MSIDMVFVGSRIKILLLLTLGLWLTGEYCMSQEPMYTQYVNSQVVVNPAFTGTRNCWSTDFLVRKQWMGVTGAPTTYMVNSHTPINKSLVSVGGMILSDVAGPLTSQQFNLYYSYLLRINNGMFLSLGIAGGFHQYKIGLTDILVLDNDDPYFGVEAQSQNQPRLGAGALLFTPKYYVSFSMPQFFKPMQLSADKYFKGYSFTSYYFSGGYTHMVNRRYGFKGSVMARLNNANQKAVDINAQYLYKRIFWAGITYRVQQTVAVLVNLQLNSNWGICYSYDFPFNTNSQLRNGSQEITLSYDCFKFYKKNRNRQFLKKKEEEDESVRSIRYF